LHCQGLGLLLSGPDGIMNSLFEVVLWGVPVVLLTCALLLAIACGLAFREESSPHEPQPF